MRVDLRVDLSGLAATEQLTEETAATVYFCCSEALQNVVKYADAGRVGIEVMAIGGELMFTVAVIDGRGRPNIPGMPLRGSM